MKLECDVIRDLLPLYAEKLASPASSALVEQHLAACPACRAELEQMEKPVPVQPEPQPDAPLKNIRSSLNRRRLRTMLCSFAAALALAAVLYGAVFGFTDTFVALFNSESSALMAEYAHSGMRIYFLGYFFAGFNIMAAGYLSAVNRPVEASVTSICRGMVAIVTCSLVLSAVFGMPGVWAAFPASELLTALLTLFLLRRKESGKA